MHSPVLEAPVSWVSIWVSYRNPGFVVSRGPRYPTELLLHTNPPGVYGRPALRRLQSWPYQPSWHLRIRLQRAVFSCGWGWAPALVGRQLYSRALRRAAHLVRYGQTSRAEPNSSFSCGQAPTPPHIDAERPLQIGTHCRILGTPHTHLQKPWLHSPRPEHWLGHTCSTMMLHSCPMAPSIL